MKSFQIATLALLAGFTYGQVDLASLPECARGCLDLGNLNGLGCQSSLDIPCICRNRQFVDGLSCCVSKSCQQADIEKTIEFANGICKAAQVTLPTAASCASSAGPTGSSSAAASVSSVDSASSAGSASSTGATTGSAASSTGSATDAAATTASSAGAAATLGSGVGMVGGIVVGLAALL